MADLPNLAGVATSELVETIGGGNFKASYINWSRTLNLLRTHAPGWLPEMVPTSDGAILHSAPHGAFLLLRFRHLDGTTTPEVPQAVMDHKNAAIPFAKVTARDITDTHRRGVCLAAALTFGLAYELWAKVALESGYGEQAEQEQPKPEYKGLPTDGAWEAVDADTQAALLKLAASVIETLAEDGELAAYHLIDLEGLDSDEKAALWTQLDSKTRSALKRAHKAANEQPQEKAA